MLNVEDITVIASFAFTSVSLIASCRRDQNVFVPKIVCKQNSYNTRIFILFIGCIIESHRYIIIQARCVGFAEANKYIQFKNWNFNVCFLNHNRKRLPQKSKQKETSFMQYILRRASLCFTQLSYLLLKYWILPANAMTSKTAFHLQISIVACYFR